MSSTLREASKDTLQAKDKTYHYYSLPLAAKSLGDTIYCNGYPRVKYRMKKHGTDNCTGIFNFFLRREIPYTNADSVV